MSPNRDYRAATLTPAMLMARAAARFRSQAALAVHLNIGPSHVARVASGRVGISAVVAVLLADLLGEDRARVLRTCGHDLLCSRLYPGDTGNTPRLRMRDAIDGLSPDDRRLIHLLIDRLSPAPSAEKGDAR
jgi:hypothetical protein